MFIGKDADPLRCPLPPKQLQALEPAAHAAWRTAELDAVKLPYLGIACVVLVWAAAGRLREIPAARARRRGGRRCSRGRLRGLSAFPRYWLGVFAQFAYVGAQVGVWSFLIRYTQYNFPGTAEKVAADCLPDLPRLFFAGRFIGTLLMSNSAPPCCWPSSRRSRCHVVRHCGALAGGDVGLYALIATSFFMSIQFPTIFTMSLRGLGAHTKSGSSFLVMAIVGGAVIPAVMGCISDASTINVANLVPAVCFAMVFLFAWKSRRENPATRDLPHEHGAREPRARTTGLAVSTLGFGGAASAICIVSCARKTPAPPCVNPSPQVCATSTPRPSMASA